MYQFSPSELSLLESSCVPQAVYQLVDKRVVTLAISAGFCELFGFQDHAAAYELMDNDMYRNVHPDDAARVADAAYRFSLEGGEYETIYRTKVRRSTGYSIIHAHGRHRYTETGERLAVVWYVDEGPYSEEDGHTWALNDSLSRALRTESRVQTSYYDALTGLPNMTSFFLLAAPARSRMLEEGKRPAVLYMDLCGMKNYNQKYGFSEGDKLILSLGRLLAHSFGNENCSRFGQDHFVVLTDAATLESRLKALFQACQALNSGRSLPLRVGVYADDRGAIGIDAACDRAKAAADRLRSSFVSCFSYYDSEMQAIAERRHYVLDNFDRALREGWIQVYYQPIIRAANGRVCDEEALARWVDPERGLLSPADFIPVLEETRLIYRLDLYVVEQTLKKMRLLRDEGLFLISSSVNLSRSDFEACDIVAEICRRVDEAGIPRNRLSIEITESTIGGDFSFMKEQLERLHTLGFPVWMDDFGSEYSSLDYLQSLRFDLLKFDMHFMQEFDRNDRTRIILTELVRMAINLGIETVAEGVETKEQADFLTEIGCTKLQGYYFSRPIPLETILDRYRNGAKIGIENPDEEAYYTAIGRINLYDISVLAREDENSLQHFFNTLPMAIIESTGETFTVVRCNQSYRAFLERMFGLAPIGEEVPYTRGEGLAGNGFLRAIRQCGRDGTRSIIDEELRDGGVVHAFIKRIAVNPITGTAALGVAVLGVLDPGENKAGISSSDIAKALSSDYFNLFYVDLDTEDFTEYRNDPTMSELAMERHGGNFFAASRRDARLLLYPDDQDAFIAAFTRENVIAALDQAGSFTADYRLNMFGEPVYVSMKAVRMKTDAHHIIIGVRNVDAQHRQEEALARIQEEQVSYARLAALADDYMSFYTVDPETGRYLEYGSTSSYTALGLIRSGEDFFADSLREIERVCCSEDLPHFKASFSREQILREIEASGLYVLRYRLMIEGEPVYVQLKAARVEEKDGVKLIFGVSNVDERVKREEAYHRSLSAARERRSRSVSTGLNRSQTLQLLCEQFALPCAVMSVARAGDGGCGEIRIVCANEPYRALMGPRYYDNMLYQDLVPRDIKFEDYCFRSAFLGQKLRAYVKIGALDYWTDESFLPLTSADSKLGTCLFVVQTTRNAEPERLASVSMNTAETVIKSCVSLLGTEDFLQGVQDVLRDIREISGAAACRILLIDEKTHTVTNYCDSLLDPNPKIGLPIGATLPYELVTSWSKLLGASNAVILTGEHDFAQLRRRNPFWAQSLKENGIDSLVLIPLYHEKTVLGYLYITNFDVEKVVELKELVELMAFFLGTEISNQLLLDQLETMSRTDALTDVGNRAAMTQRLQTLSGKPFGLLSLDLNGLKAVNDTEGHEAGDRMLTRTAELLSRVFGKDSTFRTGGDEFVIVCSSLSKAGFEERTALLIEERDRAGLSFALGACWSDGRADSMEVMRESDQSMYRDKRGFYIAHPEQVRR